MNGAIALFLEQGRYPTSLPGAPSDSFTRGKGQIPVTRLQVLSLPHSLATNTKAHLDTPGDLKEPIRIDYLLTDKPGMVLAKPSSHSDSDINAAIFQALSLLERHYLGFLWTILFWQWEIIEDDVGNSVEDTERAQPSISKEELPLQPEPRLLAKPVRLNPKLNAQALENLYKTLANAGDQRPPMVGALL